MKINGDALVHAPVSRAWEALLDPAILVRTIPGCERLEATGENTYDMTVTAGVAAITGTYSGDCRLFDLDPHHSLTMQVNGAGAPGTIGAAVQVRFTDLGEDTRIEYDADAVVGGMVGGVGQRMLSSVSRRMAGEFFANIDAAINGPAINGPAINGALPPADEAPAGPPTGPSTGPPATGQVFTAPPRTGLASREDFLKGIAVGAGLVLAGVVVGGIFGRRR